MSTQLQVLVNIADRMATVVSSTVETSPGGYRFYRDPSVKKNPPTTGFVTMSSFWQPEIQISSGPTALYLQVFNVTFSVYMPPDLGLGSGFAECEAIATLFRGLYADEVEYKSVDYNHVETDIESHDRYDVRLRCEKTSHYSWATAGYVTFEEGGRLRLE